MIVKVQSFLQGFQTGTYLSLILRI